MNPDPPVRPDNLCACGCGRPINVKYHPKADGPNIRTPEPFARTECCKTWHGVTTSTRSTSDRRGTWKRPANEEAA